MTCCLLQPMVAQELLLLEVGVEVLKVRLPAYRRAVESSTDVLPIPYIIYRGKHLKADQHGVRGVLFDNDKYEIILSFAASPPVRSNHVKVRNSMPDLCTSLELGPTLNVKLRSSVEEVAKLRLFVPVRAVVTLESDPRFIGWQIPSRLNLDVDSPLGFPGWVLDAIGGPVFGRQEQHAYFFGFIQQFSSARRPAYKVKTSFAGFQIHVGFVETVFGLLGRRFCDIVGIGKVQLNGARELKVLKV